HRSRARPAAESAANLPGHETDTQEVRWGIRRQVQVRGRHVRLRQVQDLTPRCKRTFSAIGASWRLCPSLNPKLGRLARTDLLRSIYAGAGDGQWRRGCLCGQNAAIIES